ncbi:MAG: methyltransferase domain-containing protein, partial [Gammaproteobacteria bacterium]|nr:methyltransferase domain-containing protein [Gammaproteobacteria bacterium]
MAHQHNPQEKQMADESMLRTLKAQAEAIWPQEVNFLKRYKLPQAAQILDVGCGSGEICGRLARQMPEASITGVDLIESHLQYASQRHTEFSQRLQFNVDDAMNLSFEDDRFDLCVNRHMLQSVPDADRVITEMIRVTKPGGWLHIIPEDYGMIHCSSVNSEVEDLFLKGAFGFARHVGTDLRIGRKAYRVLKQHGLKNVSVNYITVDTEKVPRDIIRDIFIAWRDGYATAMDEAGSLDLKTASAYFDEFIRCLEDE